MRTVVGIALLVGVLADASWADSPPDESQLETKSASEIPPEPDPQKQKIATVALYLLIAVTVGGVSMLVLVMLWGARVRRQVRKSLPEVTPQDPLWYLKKKPEPNVSPEVSEESNASQSPNNTDSNG